jgi:hypothetical protein
MISKFRNDLINSNKEFGFLFKRLLDSKEIEEYPDKLWEFISRDKSTFKVNNEPLAFKDLFKQDLNEGRCKDCVFHLVMLFDKFGVYSEAVECVNESFAGTSGSSYGGHWYIEVKVFDYVLCIDTSLVVTGSEEAFKKLGHKVVKKYAIDDIFKLNPSLIDYYDEMIINKNL